MFLETVTKEWKQRTLQITSCAIAQNLEVEICCAKRYGPFNWLPVTVPGPQSSGAWLLLSFLPPQSSQSSLFTGELIEFLLIFWQVYVHLLIDLADVYERGSFCARHSSRNLDTCVNKAAEFQKEHWMAQCCALPCASEMNSAGPFRVVLTCGIGTCIYLNLTKIRLHF